MCTYNLNHILMFYIFQIKIKRVVLYFEEKEKVVMFDIMFCGYSYFKLNRKDAMLFDTILRYTVMYVRSLNYIFAAINVLT